MQSNPRFWTSSCLALAIAAPLSAQAQIIAAPGSEGFPVIAANSNEVVATFHGHSAWYSNDLYLMLDANGKPGDDGDFKNDMFIFNNQTSEVGSTKSLGSFTPGTELTFRLFVNDTGDNFFSGPASRNPDGMTHARAQQDWQPGETLVSFEDLRDTPEGVNGYNDLSFSFTNTGSIAPAPVPVPAAIWMLGSSLFALGQFGTRRNKNS